MKQEIHFGNGNIQINGNGNTVLQEPPEPPDNPNLISCPACKRKGIYLEADKCPHCHYSFEKERLRLQDKERRQRDNFLRFLAIMMIAAFYIGFEVSRKFEVSFWKGFGWGCLIVVVASIVGLVLWANISTEIKKRQGKL